MSTGKHPLYNTWAQMIARCHHGWTESFPDYGARGIRVCDRWRFGEGDLSGFALFVADMGDRPVGFSLDRIRNAEGYEPSNCRWASMETQMANRGGKMEPIGGFTACRAVALAYPDLDAHSEEYREQVRAFERRLETYAHEIKKQFEM
jgi:hypothetical protein